MSEIMARTSNKAAIMNSTLGDSAIMNQQNLLFQAAVLASNQKMHPSHKRSVSDGNTIFQSLMSGRGNANGGIVSQGQHIMMADNQIVAPGQIYKSTNVSTKK